MADNSDYIALNEDSPAGTPGKVYSKCDKVVDAVLEAGVGFSPTSIGRVIASVPNGLRIERLYVDSRAFEQVTRRIYGEANPVQGRQGVRWGTAPKDALREAIATFEAMAAGNPTCDPGVRVVRHDGAVWVDLARDDWFLIRITADSWTVVEQVDVPLIRSVGMQPLPIPKPDPNALVHLAELLNITSKDDLMLSIAFMLSALWPEGPYPLLAFDGEQGSGKSTATKICRRLVDPHSPDLRAPPRSETDLVIAAQNNRIVAMDNVSSIVPEMADALCRLSSGAGIGGRKLFTNSEEACLCACRPVLANGIPPLFTRGDLADRAIVITLRRIAKADRRTEAKIWKHFEAAAPGILARLLEGIRMTLQQWDSLELPYLERLADFTRLACAAAPAFGWTKDEMLAALARNKAEAAEAVLEAEPMAWAIQQLARQQAPDCWTGTATDLMQTVNKMLYDHFGYQRWRNAGRFSGGLRRIAPLLDGAGIMVTWHKTGPAATRIITIEFVPPAEHSDADKAPIKKTMKITIKKNTGTSD
jgi:putative DNA primase/helicase